MKERCAGCGNETTTYVRLKKAGASGNNPENDYVSFCLSGHRDGKSSCWDKFVNAKAA